MVRGLRIDRVAAGRLDADDDVAKTMDGDVEGAVQDGWVALRSSPTLGQGGPVRLRQLIETAEIFGERQRLVGGAAGVGAARKQPLHQPGTRPWKSRQDIAVRGHGGSETCRTLGCVEPYAVGKAAVPVGVVGEDQPDFSFGRRCPSEMHPGGGLFGYKLNPVRHLAIGCRSAEGLLEGDGAGEDAAVDFG